MQWPRVVVVIARWGFLAAAAVVASCAARCSKDVDGWRLFSHRHVLEAFPPFLNLWSAASDWNLVTRYDGRGSDVSSAPLAFFSRTTKTTRNKPLDSTMGPDEDLPTLIQRKDHLNVLRYLRIHQIRQPETAVEHGIALLGPNVSNKMSDEMVRLAVLEQVLLAAIDVHNMGLAEKCLGEIRNSGIDKESVRFRRLLARCLEADGDGTEAQQIYDSLLQENPANLLALKRNYCILKAQVGKETESMQALNQVLQQNYSDTAAWYEMAQLRLELGDYKGAAFSLQEVLLAVPTDSKIHCELAECYATIGGLENCLLARKHMAQALELDPCNRRAQFGLVVAANAYLQEAESAGKKNLDEHEVEVAKELVKYGSEQVLESYKGSSMFAASKTLMSEYTGSL